MRLCSIINVWADCVELLPFCIKNHLEFCDGVIVVWSVNSNHGQKDTSIFDFVVTHQYQNVLFYQLEPVPNLKPLTNETRKRNQGIQIARNEGYTHFILADADELYDPVGMNAEKERFNLFNLNGLVHKLRVYIGKPTLYCDDHTLTCGIHRLEKGTYAGNFSEYPFAYDAVGRAHIDPSRRCSYTSGIEMSNVFCDHYSYIRKNIDLKINNSTANLKRSREIIHEDLRNAKPGYKSKLYHKELIECDNFFNLPEWGY